MREAAALLKVNGFSSSLQNKLSSKPKPAVELTTSSSNFLKLKLNEQAGYIKNHPSPQKATTVAFKKPGNNCNHFDKIAKNTSAEEKEILGLSSPMEGISKKSVARENLISSLLRGMQFNSDSIKEGPPSKPQLDIQTDQNSNPKVKQLDMFLTSRRNSSREKGRQQESHTSRSKQPTLVDLANSQGHFTRGSLAGITSKQNQRLLSSMNGSLFDSQHNIGKFTPDNHGSKLVEATASFRAGQLGQPVLKSAASKEIFNELLEGNLDHLSSKGGSPPKFFSSKGKYSPHQANPCSTETFSTSKDQYLNLHIRVQPEEPSTQTTVYSNKHLSTIMEELREFVSIKDERIRLLQAQIDHLMQIIDKHGLTHEIKLFGAAVLTESEVAESEK